MGMSNFKSKTVIFVFSIDVSVEAKISESVSCMCDILISSFNVIIFDFVTFSLFYLNLKQYLSGFKSI